MWKQNAISYVAIRISTPPINATSRVYGAKKHMAYDMPGIMLACKRVRRQQPQKAVSSRHNRDSVALVMRLNVLSLLRECERIQRAMAGDINWVGVQYDVCFLII